MLISNTQHGFVKSKSYLTSVISFYDKVTGIVDGRKEMDVIYLKFSKTFDKVSLDICKERYGNTV